MPRPIVSTLTGTGTGNWLPVDRFSPLTSITVVVNGTTNYTVQHTLDNVLTSSAVANAFDHDTLVAQTTNQDGNYAYPVSAIRVVNNSGTGSTTITILQSATT